MLSTENAPNESHINTSPRVTKAAVPCGKLEIIGEPEKSQNSTSNTNYIEIKWQEPIKPQPLKKKMPKKNYQKFIFTPFASLIETEITVTSLRKLTGQENIVH